MDFLTLAWQRYSVRKFKPDPVPEEAIGQILKAGHLAPTACNKQPQKIAVITGDGLAALRKCTPCHFDAPLAFLVGYDRNLCWTRSFDGKSSGDIDASIVATHMMLEAASLGIGSTWVMYFDPAALRTEFSIPESWEITAILVMGCPAEDASPSPMHIQYRDESEIVRRIG